MGDVTRSERLKAKEKLEMEVKEISEEQNRKERVKMRCELQGCSFDTSYVTQEMAQEQYKNHWKVKHEFDVIKQSYENNKAYREREREEKIGY